MCVTICIKFLDYFPITRAQIQYPDNINILLKKKFTAYAKFSLILAYFLKKELRIKFIFP